MKRELNILELIEKQLEMFMNLAQSLFWKRNCGQGRKRCFSNYFWTDSKRCVDAAEELETKGVSVEVLDMYTIKPLDVDLILSEVEGKKAVVTFENHSIIGGLGSAVAEVLAENNVNVLFKRHGVTDRFGQVGTADFLQVEYNLTSKDLVKTIESLL